MNVILDTFIVLGKCLYYFLESLFYKLIPKSKKDVAGEIVLITGAGGGIGRLMAIKFSRLGAILVLWNINEAFFIWKHIDWQKKRVVRKYLPISVTVVTGKRSTELLIRCDTAVSGSLYTEKMNTSQCRLDRSALLTCSLFSHPHLDEIIFPSPSTQSSASAPPTPALTAPAAGGSPTPTLLTTTGPGKLITLIPDGSVRRGGWAQPPRPARPAAPAGLAPSPARPPAPASSLFSNSRVPGFGAVLGNTWGPSNSGNLEHPRERLVFEILAPGARIWSSRPNFQLLSLAAGGEKKGEGPTPAPPLAGARPTRPPAWSPAGAGINPGASWGCQPVPRCPRTKRRLRAQRVPGVSQNMAPNVKSAKKVFVFLGKSVFSLLETMIFTLIPKPRKNVAGEIILITGAGSGLGRLLALKFARLGAVLVLWDINKEGNEETCNMARDAGAARAYAYTCDCGRKEEVYRVADQVKKEVGDISILINNAGIVTGKRFLDCPDELIEKAFDVNFKAHLWTYKAFLPAMIANSHGHLVCISSSAGLFGVNGLADYCASKFAAYGFAESIFFELFAQKIKGIKTTIVCPFFINTGMFEGCTTGCPSLLPILEPEYVVRKTVDAILQEKVYLCIPKFVYILMFLKSILPTKLILLTGEYVGAFHFMDGFLGKKKN